MVFDSIIWQELQLLSSYFFAATPALLAVFTTIVGASLAQDAGRHNPALTTGRAAVLIHLAVITGPAFEAVGCFWKPPYRATLTEVAIQ